MHIKTFAVSYFYLFTLIFLTVIPSANAEQENPSTSAEKWFQTELIIFKRIQGDAGQAEAETWPVDVELVYPKNVVWLKDPADTESLASEPEVVESALSLQEQPFVILAKEEMGLLDSASAINRKANIDVLFHRAWRQPFTKVEQSPSIIIYGGKKFDEHYELEGSVLLSLSRYLHLTSNLWLTEFEFKNQEKSLQNNNITKTHGCLDSINTDDRGTISSSTTIETKSDCDNNTTSHWPTLPRQPQPLPEQTTEHEGNMEHFSHINTSDSTGRYSINGIIEDPAIMEEKNTLPNYDIKSIAVLAQSRRMRSNELHYIDHPKMGIIVRITPYEHHAKTLETDAAKEE